MAGWRVHPAGVQAVLTATSSASSDTALALQPLPDQLSDVAQAADGTSGDASAMPGIPSANLIAGAMIDFSGVIAAHAGVIEARVPAATGALAAATNAVESGDETMAGQIQSAAAASWALPLHRKN